MSPAPSPAEALVLDTCVWRDAARDRTWIRAQVDAAHALAACAESTQELVVTGLTTTSDSEFEEVRLACSLARRYADVSLPPIEWHLARELGFDPGPVPDPLRVCELVASCRTRAELWDRRGEHLPVGGARLAAVSEWPRVVREEKDHWLASISKSLEGASPGIMTVRQTGNAMRISKEDYARLKGQLLGDRLAFARIELKRMEVNLGEELDLNWEDPSLVTRIDESQDVAVRAFTEAILDRFDGPHNDGVKKIRFEPNDWFDLAQLRYLQGNRRWVTSDRRWVDLARRAGLERHIMMPGT